LQKLKEVSDTAAVSSSRSTTACLLVHFLYPSHARDEGERFLDDQDVGLVGGACLWQPCKSTSDDTSLPVRMRGGTGFLANAESRISAVAIGLTVKLRNNLGTQVTQGIGGLCIGAVVFDSQCVDQGVTHRDRERGTVREKVSTIGSPQGSNSICIPAW
jgi:hypothetical protein